MANNKMWLVNKETKEKVLLAKYYPSTGWYVFHEANYLHGKLCALLATLDPPTMWGQQQWELEYEQEEEK